jgi:hypothetical protein
MSENMNLIGEMIWRGEKGSGFDFTTICEEHRDEIRRLTDEAHSISGIMRESRAKIGMILLKVKERLEHGQFLDWLEAEFSYSSRTAQRCMARVKSDKVSHLTFVTPKATAAILAEVLPDDHQRDVDVSDNHEVIGKSEAPPKERAAQKKVTDKGNRRTDPFALYKTSKEDEQSAKKVCEIILRDKTAADFRDLREEVDRVGPHALGDRLKQMIQMLPDSTPHGGHGEGAGDQDGGHAVPV